MTLKPQWNSERNIWEFPVRFTLGQLEEMEHASYVCGLHTAAFMSWLPQMIKEAREFSDPKCDHLIGSGWFGYDRGGSTVRESEKDFGEDFEIWSVFVFCPMCGERLEKNLLENRIVK